MDTHCIAIDDSAFLTSQPKPTTGNLRWGRVEGMLLGLAVGDSLGNTTENMSPVERTRKYGEISSYLPNAYAANRRVGLPSDDTQLAYWTLEQLLMDDGLNLEHLADTFASRHIYGIGRTVREFLRQFKDLGRPWSESGIASAGNGALMRIAPILLPHLRTPSNALWCDAVLASMLTHNDRGSNAACVAFVAMLWELLSLPSPPAQGWWMSRYCEIAAELEGSTHFKPRHDNPIYQHDGPLWEFVEAAVSDALRRGLSTIEACNGWYSGAYLLETVPCCIYILECHAADPEQAIIRAVNDTRDNDTVAAIVGAAVGALHGRDALPKAWVENLLGRTGADDDGHVFTLIDQAKHQFYEGP